MTDWIKAYDLADDLETVALIQRATTQTEDFGLVPEVALFGSLEWWNAVDDGRIPLQEVTGMITRLFTSGHRDWPEFELDSRGSKTRWTRVGDQSAYKEGKQVRIEFVLQKARKHWVGSQEQKQVLRIFVQA